MTIDRLTRGVLPLTAILLAVVATGCSGADERKARYYDKAQAFVAERNYEKAQLELRNSLQIDPDFLPAKLLLGKVADRLGDHRRALQMYQAALEQDATNATARAGVARIYLFAGFPEKALELVEPGLAKTPDEPDLLVVRGAVRARLGDLAAAVADAERAVTLSPKHDDAIALLASLQMRQERPEAARKLLEGAIQALPESTDLRLILADIYRQAGDLPGAERMIREVVALQPDQPSHRYALARFLDANGRVDEAVDVLRDAVTRMPDDMQAKSALINLLAARKSPEAAEKELLAFVGKSPKDMPLRLQLGDFYNGHGRTAEAAEVYAEIVERDGTGPQGLAARNRLAAAAVADKRIDEASRLVSEILEENPQDNDALILRAQMALDRGDTAAAVTDLRTVLRDQPNLVPVQRALARAYLQSNDLALAEETLKGAVEQNPGDPQLRVDLAALLVRNGQTDRAVKTLEDAVAAKPENLVAQEQLFFLYAARKDLVKAMATAGAVRAARPDLPLGHYLTGHVHRASGRNDEAVASFEAALELQPNAAEPLTSLVETLVAAGRPDDAERRVRGVVAQQAENAHARNVLGNVLMLRKRYPDAAATYGEAIHLASSWWEPYRGMALAQLAAGASDEALQTLERGFAATGGAIALGLDLAALQERRGTPDQAIATFEGLLKRSPSNELLANNLAFLLVSYRNDGASLERARQLSDGFKDSQNPAYVNTAGWVLYKLGRYAEAIPLLQRAAEMVPDSPVMRYHLAMAQYKTGQAADAQRNLEAALQTGTEFPGADDAKATLAQLKRS